MTEITIKMKFKIDESDYKTTKLSGDMFDQVYDLLKESLIQIILADEDSIEIEVIGRK